jgi:hypothetical protein
MLDLNDFVHFAPSKSYVYGGTEQLKGKERPFTFSPSCN